MGETELFLGEETKRRRNLKFSLAHQACRTGAQAGANPSHHRSPSHHNGGDGAFSKGKGIMYMVVLTTDTNCVLSTYHSWI